MTSPFPYLFLCSQLSYVLTVNLTSDMFADGLTDVRDMSCKGMCGKGRPPPCSCDMRCTVYSNCCEDFAIECPSLFVQSRETFRYLEDSQVACNRNLGMWTVVGCPPGKTIDSKKRTPMVLTPTMADTPDMMANSSRWGDFMAFFQVYQEQLPVYDSLSGVYYLNYSVHACNTEGIDTKPVFCKKKMKVDYSEVQGKIEMAVFAGRRQSVDLPPDGYEEYADGAYCLNEVIDTCLPDYSDTAVVTKCGQYYSYVAGFFGGRYFKNRYCLECNGLTQMSMVLGRVSDEVRGNFRFSVILSLDNNRFDLRTETESNSWEDVKCQLNLDSVDLVSQCFQSQECVHPSFVNHNGHCTSFSLLGLAVGEDGIPLTSWERDRLASFIKCYLTHHAAVDFVFIETGNDSYHFTSLEPSTNTPMHFVSQEGVYADLDPDGTSQHIAVFLELDALAKLFYAHRLRRISMRANSRLGGTRSTDQTLRRETDRTQDMNTIPSYPVETFYPSFWATFEDDKTNSVQPLSNMSDHEWSQFVVNALGHNVSTCSCSPALYARNDDRGACSYVVCWQTPMSVRDIAKIQRLGSSPCLKILDASKAHHACADFSFLVTWTGLIVFSPWLLSFLHIQLYPIS